MTHDISCDIPKLPVEAKGREQRVEAGLNAERPSAQSALLLHTKSAKNTGYNLRFSATSCVNSEGLARLTQHTAGTAETPIDRYKRHVASEQSASGKSANDRGTR